MVIVVYPKRMSHVIDVNIVLNLVFNHHVVKNMASTNKVVDVAIEKMHCKVILLLFIEDGHDIVGVIIYFVRILNRLDILAGIIELEFIQV